MRGEFVRELLLQLYQALPSICRRGDGAGLMVHEYLLDFQRFKEVVGRDRKKAR